MLAALLLAASMLTVDDSNALRNTRFVSQDRDQVAQLIVDRPVVLGRLTFATYTAPVSSNVLLSIQIPGGSLLPGDQFEVTAHGTAINGGGSNQGVGVGFTATQGAVSQAITSPGTIVAGTVTPIAWMSRILVSVGVANATAQVAYPVTSAGNQRGTPPRQDLSGQTINVLMTGQTLISNSFSSGFLAGSGFNASGSGVQGFKTPVLFDPSQMIQFDVTLSGVTGGSAVVTVNGGALIGL